MVPTVAHGGPGLADARVPGARRRSLAGCGGVTAAARATTRPAAIAAVGAVVLICAVLRSCLAPLAAATVTTMMPTSRPSCWGPLGGFSRQLVAPRHSGAIARRAANEPRSVTDLIGMRSREVKAFLVSKGVPVDDCFDAESLVERAIASESQWGLGYTSGNPYARSGSASSPPAASEVDAAWKRICAAWPAPDPIEEGPLDATMSVIMLHGFGDAGGRYVLETFRPLLSRMDGVRFLYPQAPAEELQGQSLQTWFMPTNGQWVVDDGVAKPVVTYLHAMVRREVARGVRPEQIFLGGFAQGGAVAARAALSFPDAPLGGLLLLSHFFGSGSTAVSPANQGIDVLVCHGTNDEIVPFNEGERAVGILQGLLGADSSIVFKSYEAKHGVSGDEVSDIYAFLSSHRAASPAQGVAWEPEPLAFDPVADAARDATAKDAPPRVRVVAQPSGGTPPVEKAVQPQKGRRRPTLNDRVPLRKSTKLVD